MIDNKREEVYAFLGPCEHSSKPRRKVNPSNLVVYNSNICFLREVKVSRFFGLFTKTTVKAERIWWGDFDLTTNRNLLMDLARTTGETVILLSETDGGFMNADNPRYENYIYKVTPGGDESFGELFSNIVKVTDDVIELIPTDEIECGCETCFCKETGPLEEIDNNNVEVEVTSKNLQEEDTKAEFTTAAEEPQPTPEVIAEAIAELDLESAKLKKVKRGAPKPRTAVGEKPNAEKPANKPRAKKATPTESTAEVPAVKTVSKPRVKKATPTEPTAEVPAVKTVTKRRKTRE